MCIRDRCYPLAFQTALCGMTLQFCKVSRACARNFAFIVCTAVSTMPTSLLGRAYYQHDQSKYLEEVFQNTNSGGSGMLLRSAKHLATPGSLRCAAELSCSTSVHPASFCQLLSVCCPESHAAGCLHDVKSIPEHQKPACQRRFPSLPL